MTKPTYEELLEALFGTTQALRSRVVLAAWLRLIEINDGPHAS